MYVELVQNAALLVALAALYSLVARLRKYSKAASGVLSGLLFGGVAVAGMMLPFHYEPGIIYDGRSIVLAMAGLFGGAFPAVISLVTAMAYRAWLGGAGVWAGIATIVACPLVGLGFRRYLRNRPERLDPASLLVFGIIVHLVMLACQLLLPWPYALDVISRIWRPVMVIFPVATMLMGLLLGTEERRIDAERRVRESEAMLGKSQAVGRVGSWEYDLKTDHLAWSDEVYSIFGVSRDEFNNTFGGFLDFVHPDDRVAVRDAHVDSAKTGEEGYEISHRIIRHDTGEERVLFQKCEHVKDTTGRVIRSIGFLQDITERVEAEDALRLYATRLRILREIDQAILQAESPEAVANAALSRLGELVPCERASVVTIESESRQACIVSVRMNGETRVGTGQRFPLDEFGVTDDLRAGKHRIIRDLAKWPHKSPIHEVLLDEGIRSIINIPLIASGELIGVLNLGTATETVFDETDIEIAWDVANQMAIAMQQARLNEKVRRHANELEHRVAERTAQLEDANRELEAFAYSVSHDLRAPLRAITGFAQILRSHYLGALDEEGRHYLDNIHDAAERMESLITDLLDYSRLGKDALPAEGIHLAPLIDEVISELEPKRAQTRAQILVSGDLPVVTGVPSLLRQVFLNLIDNALEYHRPSVQPRVEITAEVRENWAVVRVADNGSGIPHEYHDKVFNIFQRLHSHDTHPGTGIGLATVKKAVSLMGGTVSLESEPGQGSVFHVRLPSR